MSRELDLLSNEYKKKPATVMIKHALLINSNLHAEIAQFIRDIEQQCKRKKSVYVKVIAVIDQ
jgi:hypothetical protein